MPRHPSRFLFSSLLLLAASPVVAAPPTVTSMAPHGAERGKTVDLVITGTNLTQPRLVLPFKATQALIIDPKAKPNPAQARIRLTVDAAVAPGIYPIRVITSEGVSSPLLFHVDLFPAVAEVEDNSSFAKAQKVTVPVVIDGQCAGGDVDYFRFAAKKGQRLVLETLSARLGSGILPQLRLTDARQRFVASDDSQALHGDGRILFTAPEEGDYVVEISDTRYRGANPPHYRLRIADYDVAEEVFPLGGRPGDKVEFVLRGGNLGREVRFQRLLPAVAPGAPRPTRMTLDPGAALKPGMLAPTIALGEFPERIYPDLDGKESKPLDVAPPLTINGRLTRKGAVHRLRFPVKTGERYRLTVEADALGSALDGVLRVTDQAGKQLALVDDVDLPPPAPGMQGTKSPDPSVEIAVPAGVTALGVELRDGRHHGGLNFVYRLTIEPAAADFTVQQPTAEVNVPRGGSVALTVPIARRGYNGPIQLGLTGLAPGFSVQGGYVPAGASQGILSITAGGRIEEPPLPLSVRIEGRALEPGVKLQRWAAQPFVVARDSNVAVATMPLSEFAVALTGTNPFSVQGSPTIEVVNGYPTTVKVAVTRRADAKVGAVALTGVSPAFAAPGKPAVPGGLSFKPGSATAGEGTFQVSAVIGSPAGRTVDFVVQGKAKVNNADRIVTGPAIPVTVVAPFRVELLTRALTLTPGQVVLLKGKIERRPVFRETVQLKLDGLPKGVTAAPPKAVAAGQSEFQIELRVDATIALASPASVRLTCSAAIGGMTYTHPVVVVPVQGGPKR